MKSQEEFLHEFYDQFDDTLRCDVEYVETHGLNVPGSSPTDELHTLAAVLCGGREWPLHVGSVKTNVGHTFSVSGNTLIARFVQDKKKHCSDIL